MKKPGPDERIIVALDFSDFDTGKEWGQRLKERISTFKIGPVMFMDKGFSGLGELGNEKTDFFLDLKLHDIPNTLRESVRNIVNNEISMFTLHSLGGYEMMRTVCETVSEQVSRSGAKRPMVLAVTVLTSHDKTSLNSLGIAGTVEDEVLRLASIADRAGIDGLVCSGLEVETLRREFGKRFKLVVPGVRTDDEKHDQKRVVTPAEAISRGADYIVVGRSITKSQNPEATLDLIIRSITD